MPSPTAFTDRPHVAALLRQVACLTTDELKPLLAGHPSAHDLSHLRASMSIFGFRFAHVGYLYPAFQFERCKERIAPAVVRINRVILPGRSQQEALDWWQAGTESPVDLLEAGRHHEVMRLALCRAGRVH